MSPQRKQRVGRNEALLRDVNEGIERGQWHAGPEDPIRFRCECAGLDCNRMIELTMGEYEQLREHPRRFMVIPGHEVLETEAVVQTNPDYLFVEKRAEAGVVAEELDPRS
jgi:hypothetical protein